MPKEHIPLPGDDWMWETHWQVFKGKKIPHMDPAQEVDGDVDHDGEYDKDGWQYAPEFTARFSGTPKMTDFVRRRKWVRTAVKVEKAASFEHNSAKKNLNVP